MNMRAKRLVQWILTIAIAAGLIFGEGFIKQAFFTEKTQLTVNAPEDMKDAFKAALSASGLSSQYEIVMTDSVNADITIGYGKENDDSYTKFVFSPFVIAYNTSDTCFKSLKKANTVVPSEFNDKFYEIDFLKVIDEVVEEGQWENLGLSNHNKIRLFYPAETTVYWHDFYNFMLLTANGGTYPKTDDEMTKAVQKIERFIKSPCTEAVTNFDEKIERTNGFAENALYVITEKTVYDLAVGHSEKTRLFFPLITVNFNYYVRGNSESGKTVVSSFNNKFYSKLEYKDYRSEYAYELGDDYEKVYDERDVYQIVEIPKENFFTGDYSVEKE